MMHRAIEIRIRANPAKIRGRVEKKCGNPNRGYFRARVAFDINGKQGKTMQSAPDETSLSFLFFLFSS